MERRGARALAAAPAEAPAGTQLLQPSLLAARPAGVDALALSAGGGAGEGGAAEIATSGAEAEASAPPPPLLNLPTLLTLARVAAVPCLVAGAPRFCPAYAP